LPPEELEKCHCGFVGVDIRGEFHRESLDTQDLTTAAIHRSRGRLIVTSSGVLYTFTMNRLRWSALFGLVAISFAVGQTEDQYRQFVAHVQQALGLHEGAIVADIGTGDSPDHPLHISKAVGPSGKVLCVDINEKALEQLRGKLKEKGAINVETHLGKVDDPLLSDNTLDAVLISNAYHHFTEHASMLRHIRAALRPEGRLVVIESISEKNRSLPRERQLIDHELSPEILGSELKAAGFESANGAETLVDNGGVLRYLISARVSK
jgi:ubiquinone/menaquinone biosynthesis C-methylase UbiE